MAILSFLVVLGSAFFSYLMNQILFRFTRNMGVHGTSSDGTIIRWGSTSKPAIGGISFYITFILAALVFFIVQGGEAGLSKEFLGLLATVTVGFVLGLSDDAYNTKPLLKFLLQVTCGVIMILFGVYIQLTGIAVLDYALTIFWVVGIMNSINLLDNMDGVTGSVSVFIMASAAVVMLLYPMAAEVNPFYFTVMACIGAVTGFLFLNWNPSKIYMGDTGSQFLGALLAFIGVKFFWNIQNMNYSVVTSMQVITPVMVFLVPIMDTSFVFVSRIMRGQSPFVGGKDHLTHNLFYIGVQERWVPVVLGLVSGMSGLLAIFTVRYVFQWNHIYTAIFSAYIVVSMAAFYLLYRRGARVGKVKEYLKTKASSKLSAAFPANEKLKSRSPQKQVN